MGDDLLLEDIVLKIAAESTCKKRSVVCVLLSEEGEILACETNLCFPLKGCCTRLNTVNQKVDYPAVSDCNWVHAEVRALSCLEEDDKPYTALIYGHNFVCPECERKLRAAGVKDIQLIHLEGVGLK